MKVWFERALPVGVYRRGNKYEARIGVDSKQRYLGAFPTAEAASAAYQEARRRREEGTFEEDYPRPAPRPPV